MDKINEELLAFIGKSTSSWHTVENSAIMLKNKGFQELFLGKCWHLEHGGRYFIRGYGSSLFAFVVGVQTAGPLRIAAAHTDFPGWRVKPSAGIKDNGSLCLNVESYGGLINTSWQDRPLSLAGCIALRGSDAFAPEIRLVDMRRPCCTIPSLAIHMDRKANETRTLERQRDMLPLAGISFAGEADDWLEALAAEAGCQRQEVLSYDLNVYAVEEGCVFGLGNELVSAPRLDNLTSVKACLDGISSCQPTDGLRLVALFDNEEVGSRTKQGAASSLLGQIVERIYRGLQKSREDIWQALDKGFLLSVDTAHAQHPRRPEKCDVTNKPRLNGGVAIKQAASQSYAGEAFSLAVVLELCRQADIPCQRFVNNSDLPGGSTIGSLLSASLPIRAQDIGVALLAMHAVRETMGAEDQAALTKLLQVFFV